MSNDFIFVGDLSPAQKIAVMNVVAEMRKVSASRSAAEAAAWREANTALPNAPLRPELKAVSLVPSGPGIVYFMRHVPSGHVKIGRTTNLRSRRMSVSNGGCAWPPGVAPSRVDVIAARMFRDAFKAEREIHDKFCHLRVEGTEWFLAARELVDFARSVAIDGTVWDKPA